MDVINKEKRSEICGLQDSRGYSKVCVDHKYDTVDSALPLEENLSNRDTNTEVCAHVFHTLLFKVF